MRISTKKSKRYVAEFSEEEVSKSSTLMVACCNLKKIEGPERIELSLSKREAEVLMCVMGKVCSRPESAGAVTSTIYKFLTDLLLAGGSSSDLSDKLNIQGMVNTSPCSYFVDYNPQE